MIDQKKERYTEAFARIDSSINSEHYFEAIAIEESIISDRIAPCISKEVRSYQRNQGVQPMNIETDLRCQILW